jgi:hypothetical protein
MRVGPKRQLRRLFNICIVCWKSAWAIAVKSIPRLVWLVPVVLLVVATSRLPYGYYTFMRIVTCGIAAVIAFAGFRDRPVVQAWSVLLALVAVLFNPIVPVHLDRQTWFYLDLGAAAVFVAHLIFVRWP